MADSNVQQLNLQEVICKIFSAVWGRTFRKVASPDFILVGEDAVRLDDFLGEPIRDPIQQVRAHTWASASSYRMAHDEALKLTEVRNSHE